MAKRRKAQDATIRNVKASKRRDGKLTARVKTLEGSLEELAAEVARIRHSIRSLSSSL